MGITLTKSHRSQKLIGLKFTRVVGAISKMSFVKKPVMLSARSLHANAARLIFHGDLVEKVGLV